MREDRGLGARKDRGRRGMGSGRGSSKRVHFANIINVL